MNFDFSSEQYMLRDSVRRYLTENWGAKKVRAARGAFDPALWAGLSDLGVQTLLVPESFGGAGLGFVDIALVLEEFGRALVPAPMAETILAAQVIARYGAAKQQAALLPAIADASARLTFAHVEAGAGYSVEDVKLAARKDADGWRLSGRKILVPAAAAATHYLVSARTDDGKVALFICETGAATAVHAKQVIDSDALLASVEFSSASAHPIGDIPSPEALSLLLECSAFSAAMQMTGVAAHAMEMAVDYAKQRVQFGRPIGSFQAIKHRFADMLVTVEGARTACYYASWALSAGDGALAVSMAKAVAGDACRLACNESLQIHGGVGFTWEFDIHLFLKRGKLLEYAFGDAAMHRERIASRVMAADSVLGMTA